MLYCGNCQLMGSAPCCFKNAFVVEKCLQPINPACALNGDGCAVFKMWWLFTLSSFSFWCAGAPHNRNTTFFVFRPIKRITSSVNCSAKSDWIQNRTRSSHLQSPSLAPCASWPCVPRRSRRCWEAEHLVWPSSPSCRALVVRNRRPSWVPWEVGQHGWTY